ncbi:MAG: hypothetical protein FWE36_07450 [Erysipelotrichales bacterium]|nr:hypothetical protein [Erysipelotrichales bacterium]
MEWLRDNYWILLIALGVIIFLLFLLFLIKRPKKKVDKIKVDQEYLDQLITTFGKENIKEVSLEGSRLIVTVNQIEIVDLPMLKSLSSGGVFIKENTLKLLFKYQSALLKTEIIKKIKG